VTAYHVIADQDGEIVAWLKVVQPSAESPALLIAPASVDHALLRDVEVDDKVAGRAELAARLAVAVRARRSG
jgi:hypothetical protein